jgi:peroxiredoxin
MYRDFEAEGISIVAGSVDQREKALETSEKLGLQYPIAYGMNPEEVSRITGAFYEAKRGIIHATGFLLRPGGSVEVACYSTGPVGRFVAKEILGLVRFYKSRAKT